MRECLYCWLVEPIRPRFLDESSAAPAVEIPIHTKKQIVRFAVFLDENGLPAYGRLRFTCGNADEIPNELMPLLQAVREHFLTLLRLDFSANVNLFPRTIWWFIDYGADYSYGLDMRPLYSAPVFDSSNFQKLFTSGFDHREELRLLLDGTDTRIPLQYRYLSLYRLLELVLRPDREWKKRDLCSELQPYSDRLKAAGFLRNPVNTLHELRDGCAHIANGQEFGVTHLRFKQTKKVEKFLPILLDVCLSLLNKKFGASLTVGRGPKPMAEPTSFALNEKVFQ